MMNTPVVKGAMEMGFGRKLVKQTVQRKIVISGENYKSVIELVTDLLNAEDDERQDDKERKLEEMTEGILLNVACSFIGAMVIMTEYHSTRKLNPLYPDVKLISS